ncbi:MAG: hypothetical protein RLZZ524_943, partial [Pseudomonadota bacterium]
MNTAAAHIDMKDLGAAEPAAAPIRTTGFVAAPRRRQRPVRRTPWLAQAPVQRALLPLLVALVLLGAWQAWVVMAGVPAYLVPSPTRIASTLVEDFALLTGAL